MPNTNDPIIFCIAEVILILAEVVSLGYNTTGIQKEIEAANRPNKMHLSQVSKIYHE